MKNKIYLTAFLFFLLFSPFFYSSKQVAAQEIVIASPSPTLTLNVDKAKQFGVIYPITELENCADFTACRAYCAEPENKQACIAYAEKKGFYKRSEELTKRQQLLAKARFELGCGNEVLCKRLCDLKENFERCREFGIKFKPETERARKIQEQTVVEKAKLLLGCTTPMECKTLCEEENNKQKCSDFFRQLGLRKEASIKRIENIKQENPIKIASPSPYIQPNILQENVKKRERIKIMVSPTIFDEPQKNTEEVKGVSDQKYNKTTVDYFKDFMYFLMYGTSR